MKKQRLNNKGFTIIELMISTIVFSVIIMLVTGVIVRLSKQYYSGLSRSRTQEVARTVAEEIAKGIQYSNTTPKDVSNPSQANGWCIGTSRYAYVSGEQVNGSSGGLVRSPGCDAITSPPDASASPGSVQMLSERMRISNLTITSDPANEFYQIVVRVALGDDEQLNNPVGPNASCKYERGNEFCAVSEYKMIVVRRL